MTPSVKLMTDRRAVIRGLGSSIIAAPAIVRASSLMAIKPIEAEALNFTPILIPPRWHFEFAYFDARGFFGRAAE